MKLILEKAIIALLEKTQTGQTKLTLFDINSAIKLDVYTDDPIDSDHFKQIRKITIEVARIGRNRAGNTYVTAKEILIEPVEGNNNGDINL